MCGDHDCHACVPASPSDCPVRPHHLLRAGTSNANNFPPDTISNRDWDTTEVGKMKRKMAGILVCLLSLVGCNNDVQAPVTEQRVTVNTVKGPVVIENADRNLDQKVVNAHVVGTGIDATLTVISTDDGGTHSVIASLADPSGQLLYSIETRVNEGTGAVTCVQATAEDYLSVTVSGDGDRVRETYDADGDVASFEYTALSDEQQRHAINYYQHGMNEATLPGDVVEYVRQADAFHAYYLPHESSSIHGNPAGDMLAQLLASPELPHLVVGDIPVIQMNKYIQQTCNTFSLCAVFSCRIAPGSPVCDYCFAVSIICSIMMLGCSWFGC